MNTDGSNVIQITDNGQLFDATWTIDGRLLTGWGWKDQQEFCHNCVVTPDGSEIIDAGGKGTLVNFIPFVTLEGVHVELVYLSDFEGNSEIYQFGENLPDTLGLGFGNVNLTNNPAEDSNPSWPAKCVTSARTPQVQNAPAEPQTVLNPQDILIGYEGDLDPQARQYLQTACTELNIQCIEGKDIPDLVSKEVNAILSFSNQWKVIGDSMTLWSAVEESKIPTFVLNVDSDQPGVYNLSTDLVAMTSSLEWMIKEMDGQGELIYYNFGENGFYQSNFDKILAIYPGITATAKPGKWETDSISQEEITALVQSNSNIRGIWSNNEQNDIFWGVAEVQRKDLPALLCSARQDALESWKNQLDQNPNFKCYTSIQPGGTAYEGVYVAYYFLSGLQIDPAALGGNFGNTFLYDYPIITSENLADWLAKIDTLLIGDWGNLKMP
ncbi:MAG: hypothetical protein AAGU05_07375, partial [Anaerolineaceae bacterium]